MGAFLPGKSTALSWMQNAFTGLGYTVLFVPETATELISNGVAPWTCGTNAEYQKCQLKLQLEKEALFLQAARTMAADKILIVCDRGALDNKAYMTDAEFAEVLQFLGANEVELRDSYDAVFHLVTAAKGAEEFYTAANNAARTETPAEAVALDDKLLAAWTGHPHQQDGERHHHGIFPQRQPDPGPEGRGRRHAVLLRQHRQARGLLQW